MNYTIGDFIIQLKNASLARKKEVITSYANLSKAVAKVLVKEGFLDSVTEETIDGRRHLIVKLRYVRRRPTLTDVALVSKPSLRAYVPTTAILKKQGKAETTIISTNIGVITGKEAVKKGVGGELLFKVW